MCEHINDYYGDLLNDRWQWNITTKKRREEAREREEGRLKLILKHFNNTEVC